MVSRNRRGIIAALAGLTILVAVNLAIAGKERLLANGRTVYLRLAPVDPRSLMQGDYMALNFEVANEVLRALPRGSDGNEWQQPDNQDGRIIVSLDDQSIASFARFDDGRPLAANEALMRYRIRNGQLKFASNAFFFQEGQAEAYVTAKFGEFRVDDGGELLLTRLRDENLAALGPGS